MFATDVEPEFEFCCLKIVRTGEKAIATVEKGRERHSLLRQGEILPRVQEGVPSIQKFRLGSP